MSTVERSSGTRDRSSRLRAVRAAFCLAALGWMVGCGGREEPAADGAPAADSAPAVTEAGSDESAADDAGATESDGTKVTDSAEAVDPTGATTPDATPDSAPEWTVGIVDRGAPSAGAGGAAVLSGLAFARESDFVRIVLTFAEGGRLPGYHLEYVDRPLHECGSGRPVYPEGDAWLEVRLSPAAAHTEAGESALPASEMPVDNAPGVLRVYRTCDFEGVLTLVLALDAPEAFRVLRDAEEGRLEIHLQR